MGSGGGGGDGGMQMMMTMMMMQSMQKQMEEQRRQQEAQMKAQAAAAEQKSFQRYQDLTTNQNKKVGDQWDLYNANMDKILKLNPQYNAHKKYTFDPYTTNSYNGSGADDLYAKLDRQSLDDYNMAKSQYDASKTWLSEAQAAQDAAGRVLPGAPPGTWGAGGEQVSGGAGADSLDKNASATSQAGLGTGADIYNNFGSGAGGATSAGGVAGSAVGMGGGGTQGSGFLTDPKDTSLAGVMGQAVGTGGGSKAGAGYSIF